MSLPVDAGEGTGLDQPSLARVRDYWLEGSHHDEADRELADQIMVCAPWLPYLVRCQRAAVLRMVRHLLRSGVRQFIDLGSGIPTAGYIHDVTQEVEPDSRVLYVDRDAGIADAGRELIVDHGNVAFLRADIRQPNKVLESPDLQRLIDLNEPVAILMIETLLHIPDYDAPAAIVASYRDAMCAGSYLGISHFSKHKELLAGLNLFKQMFGTPPTVTLRDPEQLAEFFTGLRLVEPGVVPVPLWRPDSEDESDRNPEQAGVYVGLGRKP